MSKKTVILFLCTGNSCRSQMAEGLAKYYQSDVIDAYSAGINPQGLNPLAVKAMAELGIDISQNSSKHLNEYEEISFDYVYTLCDNANETCPVFTGQTIRRHWGFDDPPFLAKDCKSEDESLVYYRRVRDEIKDFIQQLPATLKE